jgi:hypothetical protein
MGEQNRRIVDGDGDRTPGKPAEPAVPGAPPAASDSVNTNARDEADKARMAPDDASPGEAAGG